MFGRICVLRSSPSRKVTLPRRAPASCAPAGDADLSPLPLHVTRAQCRRRGVLEILRGECFGYIRSLVYWCSPRGVMTFECLFPVGLTISDVGAPAYIRALPLVRAVVVWQNEGANRCWCFACSSLYLSAVRPFLSWLTAVPTLSISRCCGDRKMGSRDNDTIKTPFDKPIVVGVCYDVQVL